MADVKVEDAATEATNKLFWEVEKLKAEVQNLRRPPLLSPATWVSVGSVMAAALGIGLQWQRSNVESERANIAVDKAEVKLAQVQFELRDVEEKKLRTEEKKLRAEAALKTSEQRYGELVQLIADMEKQLSNIQAQASSLSAGAGPRDDLTRVIETAQQNLQQARFDLGRDQISNLIAQANADSADVRKPATARLLREYGRSPLAIDLVLEQFSDANVVRLSPSGRINLLEYLNGSDPRVWTQAQKKVALEGIARARARAASGVAAIGSETDRRLKQLEARLGG
jgi:hypothetical protein